MTTVIKGVTSKVIKGVHILLIKEIDLSKKDLMNHPVSCITFVTGFLM